MNKIAAIGMFDGVHLGHAHLWRQIGAMCAESGATSLAVTFRNHPLELIAPGRVPRMLCSVDERVELLRRAGADDVLVLDFTPALRALTAAEFVEVLARRHGVSDLVMGFNHSIGSDRVSSPEGFARVSDLTGVRLHPAPEYKVHVSAGEPEVAGCMDIAVSSSAVRQALASGDVSLAAVLLGRPYEIGGIVGHGRQLGRTIGFPTANIEGIDPCRAMPAPGVYALDVMLPDGSLRRAMVNIGSRPTVESEHDAPATVEVNIFGFDGNLYGRKLRLFFLKRLRSERRFDSLEDLRTQLEADRREAEAIRLHAMAWG